MIKERSYHLANRLTYNIPASMIENSLQTIWSWGFQKINYFLTSVISASKTSVVSSSLSPSMLSLEKRIAYYTKQYIYLDLFRSSLVIVLEIPRGTHINYLIISNFSDSVLTVLDCGNCLKTLLCLSPS